MTPETLQALPAWVDLIAALDALHEADTAETRQAVITAAGWLEDAVQTAHPADRMVSHGFPDQPTTAMGDEEWLYLDALRGQKPITPEELARLEHAAWKAETLAELQRIRALLERLVTP